MHLILDTTYNIVLIEYIICYCVQLEKLMLIAEEYILRSEGCYNFLLTDLLYDTSHRISSTSATGFSRTEQERKSRKFVYQQWWVQFAPSQSEVVAAVCCCFKPGLHPHVLLLRSVTLYLNKISLQERVSNPDLKKSNQKTNLCLKKSNMYHPPPPL